MCIRETRIGALMGPLSLALRGCVRDEAALREDREGES